MRVLIGLSEIVWYYRNLRMGFEELGIECWQVNLDDAVTFDRVYDSDLPLANLARKTGRLRRSTNRRQIVRRLATTAMDYSARTLLLWWCVLRCDAFIFGLGTVFVHPLEVAVLRALGKKVVFVFHGSDERPLYANGSLTPAATDAAIDQCIRKTRKMRQRLRVIDRYATAVVSNPLSSHLHDRDVVMYQRIGHPFRVPYIPLPVERPAGDTIRILHSPSDAAAKGSQRIRDAVARVVAKGYKLELMELVNVPNTRVFEELVKCDFVIDQAYSDTPMSGFVAEAAALGKPAVVGGYGWDELQTILPPEIWPPSECCHPDDLDAVIERLASDVAYRCALGERAREFVLTTYSCRAVAERLARVCDGRIPADWLFSPLKLRYVHGCSISEERARALVERVVAKGGAAALQLDTKPELENRYLAFASGS